MMHDPCACACAVQRVIKHLLLLLSVVEMTYGAISSSGDTASGLSVSLLEMNGSLRAGET